MQQDQKLKYYSDSSISTNTNIRDVDLETQQQMEKLLPDGRPPAYKEYSSLESHTISSSASNNSKKLNRRQKNRRKLSSTCLTIIFLLVFCYHWDSFYWVPFICKY